MLWWLLGLSYPSFRLWSGYLLIVRAVSAKPMTASQLMGNDLLGSRFPLSASHSVGDK